MTGLKLKGDRDLLGVTAAERRARVDNHRRIRERDELLVELVDRCGGRGAELKINVYGGHFWREDRHLEAPAPAWSATRKLLWQLFRLDPDPPSSRRQLAQIRALYE